MRHPDRITKVPREIHSIARLIRLRELVTPAHPGPPSAVPTGDEIEDDR